MHRLFICLLCLFPPFLPAQPDSSGVAGMPVAGSDLTTWEASEGMSRFRQNGLFGFRDSLGRVAVAAKFDKAADFSEGLARVAADGLEGFIAKDGSIAIPLEYKRVWSFRDSMAMARVGVVYGFLNHSGEWAIQPVYDHAMMPEEGLIVVKKGDKYGYLNLQGDVVIPLMYDQATPFFQGKAQVEMDGARFQNDKSGHCIEGCDPDE